VGVVGLDFLLKQFSHGVLQKQDIITCRKPFASPQAVRR
jgi:hypothetical protein